MKTKTHFKLSGYYAASTQLKIMDHCESKLHLHSKILDGSKHALLIQDSVFVELNHPGNKFQTVTLTVIRLAQD